MNILFAVFAAIYAAIGITTLWAPLLSSVFFMFFGFALFKSLTYKKAAPALVRRNKRS